MKVQQIDRKFSLLLTLGALMLLAGAVFATSGATPAHAANGSNLRTIIADRTGTACASTDVAGHHAGVGVGIAFDGTNLLISCYTDNTVTKVTTLGAQVEPPHVIAGATSLGALAYNGANGDLYGCSGFGQVGKITLGPPLSGTGSFAMVFDTSTISFVPVGGSGNGSGCFDGLAYDGTDGTIWASGDVSHTTEHYTLTGGAIKQFTNSLGSCGTNPAGGNSGIAVGGANLYLANNGCSEIYTVNKTSYSATFFASFSARIEDMECDSVTFAPAHGAIWSIDAYDNILNAWEITPGLCAFGGGAPNPTFCPGCPVGGLVALPIAGSGSDFPWMMLIATVSGALPLLAAGLWYGRKRSLS
jgi:hypothetical protein